MRRPGVTALELLLVIGIIAITAGISVPFYRNYLIRNDLNTVAEQTVQAIGRAQLLSQVSEGASVWGFHVPTGTLYKGVAYASRDAGFDEVYPIPSTIAVSGLSEVSFSRIEGKPSQTGSIILTALNGEQRTVTIGIANQGIAINLDDELTICHKPGTTSCDTKVVPDNAWPGHQGHGDMLGPCTPAQCEDDDDDGGDDD